MLMQVNLKYTWDHCLNSCFLVHGMVMCEQMVKYAYTYNKHKLFVYKTFRYKVLEFLIIFTITSSGM